MQNLSGVSVSGRTLGEIAKAFDPLRSILDGPESRHELGELSRHRVAPPAPKSMAQVVVAEDNQALQLLFAKILRHAGHDVHLADNGEQALRLFLRHPIDVVVTDIQMPRGDGIELIAALKGLYPDASIVAISGQGPEKMELARTEGARIVLTKPIDRAVLLQAVDDAVGALPATT